MTPCIFLLAWALLPESFFVAVQLGVHDTDLSQPTATAMAGRSNCEKFIWDATASKAHPFGNFPGLTEGIFDGQDATTCLGRPVGDTSQEVTWYGMGFCVTGGLWAGLLIGFVTEFFTSKAFSPVQRVAQASSTGAATNMIYGLALGYESVVIPVLALSVAIYLGFALAQ